MCIQGSSEPLVLTEHEKKAKEFWLNFLLKGLKEECDESLKFEMELPSWFDEEKFKRGQNYFKKNRFALFNADLSGLFSLLADPNGLAVIEQTGKSSTKETSRKRYVQTTFYTVSWYENELKPGSKSWKDVEKVRRMHFAASKQAKSKIQKLITQMEVAITAFGFMGFVVTRKHLIGMGEVPREDDEALIFFWSVICHMLGVKDEYNFCHNPYEVVLILCDMIRRYILLPSCQLETPMFMMMAKAFYEGQAEFMPKASLESLLFCFRRSLGLPGYQYKVDMSKETLHRVILTDAEIKEIQSFYLGIEHYAYTKDFLHSNLFPLLTIQKRPQEEASSNKEETKLSALHKILDLKHEDEMKIEYIKDEEWAMYLNDSAYHRLDEKDQAHVDFYINACKRNQSWWGHFLHDRYITWNLKKMEPYK